MKYVLFIPLIWCGSVWAAQNAWISDALRTSVVDRPTSGARFLGTIQAGEAVREIGRSPDGEYVQIKTPSLSGWVLARNVMSTPSIHASFAAQSQRLAALTAENQQLLASNAAQKAALTTLQKAVQGAKAGEDNAKAELIALQRASSNVVAIDSRNRELQAALVSLEQENLSLKHKNLRLSEDVTQRQMYAGGLLVLAGFILNWLGGFFRFTSRRRRSFDEL